MRHSQRGIVELDLHVDDVRDSRAPHLRHVVRRPNSPPGRDPVSQPGHIHPRPVSPFIWSRLGKNICPGAQPSSRLSRPVRDLCLTVPFFGLFAKLRRFRLRPNPDRHYYFSSHRSRPHFTASLTPTRRRPCLRLHSSRSWAPLVSAHGLACSVLLRVHLFRSPRPSWGSPSSPVRLHHRVPPACPEDLTGPAKFSPGSLHPWLHSFRPSPAERSTRSRTNTSPWPVVPFFRHR